MKSLQRKRLKLSCFFIDILSSLINHGCLLAAFAHKHGFSLKASVLLLLVDIVVQKLDNEIDVGQNHASAAVALATQFV